MDKAARMLPERGALFTSKYAHRTGNGLPIFTTERAAERRHQVNESPIKTHFISSSSNFRKNPNLFYWIPIPIDKQ